MTQSDEKWSSHQSLAPNIAAMYALSGKQTTPAPGQKTVERDDVAIGKVNVQNIQSCTMCDSYGASISEQSSKSKTAHGTSVSGKCDLNLFETADTSSKAHEAIRLDMLA